MYETRINECAGKAMISQPMGGVSEEEIVATRDRAICHLREHGYLFENTLFTDEWYAEEEARIPGWITNRPLFFLARSLEAMSRCNAVYFCKGWENARGCKIEHDAAVAYGLEIIYEDKMENKPEIHVSTFPHNMQSWYEEKLTIVMNALNIIKENIDLLSSDVTKRDLINFPLDTAMIYTQDVLDMSTGKN